MRAIIVILSITIFVLVLMSIIFIYLYTTTLTSMIDPSNCPQQIADYGVNTKKIGTVLQTCGLDESSACTFEDVPDLESAIEICRFNSGICRAFSFAPANLQQSDGTFSGIMSIIDTGKNLIDSNTYDTYIEQTETVLIT